MATPRELLLTKAAEVVCELSAGQADALAYEISIATAPRLIRQIGGLAAPAAVTRMCELWIECKDVDGSGLADAIRCAARAVKSVSSYEKVELLYTGPDSGALRRNLQGLLEVIRGARERLWVVSYVIVGVADVLRALEERASAGVMVNVLVDHRPDKADLAFQRLATEAPGCHVHVWPDEERKFAPGKFASLHAKFAVADGRQAFVSSANLTGYAMDHNLEVGYLVTGGSTPQMLERHMNDLVGSGALVQTEVT
jgi:cardiolipin synthase